MLVAGETSSSRCGYATIVEYTSGSGFIQAGPTGLPPWQPAQVPFTSGRTSWSNFARAAEVGGNAASGSSAAGGVGSLPQPSTSPVHPETSRKTSAIRIRSRTVGSDVGLDAEFVHVDGNVLRLRSSVSLGPRS